MSRSKSSLAKAPIFFLASFQFRLQIIGGPAGDRGLAPFIIFQDYLLDLGIDGGRGFPVKAINQVFDLIGDHFIFAEKNIHDRLDADDLRGRGDQGRGAQFLTGNGDLGIDLVQTVQGLGLFKLADQVGDHPAGHLMDQDGRVDHRHPVGGQKIAGT